MSDPVIFPGFQNEVMRSEPSTSQGEPRIPELEIICSKNVYPYFIIYNFCYRAFNARETARSAHALQAHYANFEFE